MKQVDEIIYDAIKADSDLMDQLAYQKPDGSTGYAVVSTCFEVPPDKLDNTPLPQIIITDDGFQNQIDTKDEGWAGDHDRVQVGVDVAASSPEEVKNLIRQVRKAVENYVILLPDNGESIPDLESLSSDGLAWDWMKPCYYQRLTYQCVINVEDNDDEQEDE